jgi:dipeptidyl aminopeptidase/acylaminoacyl peptidase
MRPAAVSSVSEANHISKEEPGRCMPWTRVLLRCLGLLGTAYLTMYCNSAFCSGQMPEGPSTTSAAQTTVPAGLTKRPATVADSIQMTRLGDVKYTDGWPSKGMVAKFSPDGKHFVVILKKGNLESNTNVYSLVLFQTAEAFQSREPQVLVSLASSSNRPGIDNVRWLDDNDTILFLGENPGEPAQPYSLKCSSKELTKLTSHSANITSFVAAANGEVMVFTSRNPPSTLLTENASRHGITVTNEEITDLIRGSSGGDESDDHSLFIKRRGQESEDKIVLQGRIGVDRPKMAISPDGSHLIVQTEAAHVSSSWSEYQDQFLKMARHSSQSGDRTGIYQYELVDMRTAASQALIDAPLPTGRLSEVAWSPDSKSVVVSDVYLSLDVDDPAERALRKAHYFLVEMKIPSRQAVKVSDEDLRFLSWDPKTGYIACDVGLIDSINGKAARMAYFRKNGETWTRSSTPEQSGVLPPPDILLDEGMNTPPHIVASDPATGRKSPLMDLNPQFQNLALARVEDITWKDSHGKELMKGGLYWPTDYVAGKRYPLVIQTHGWTTNKFLMDGAFPTAFAAQALAGKGFFVLQDNGPDWHLSDTPKEAQRAMAAYEGAINYLDHRGLIDRNRVGITGFSRTFWYVTYTLTHSQHHFQAAAIADGVDFSYFQYVAFSSADPEMAGEFEQVYGGPPYGKRLTQWLKQSPSFLMDKVQTPLRIQTLGPESVLFDWHWYSGLSRLGKPVEMIYIPDGTHILEKPWERMTSQQGNVDWFCFWLKGEEDPDPGKAEQYKRWRELRKLQEKN